jgi:hypothetical protein
MTWSIKKLISNKNIYEVVSKVTFYRRVANSLRLCVFAVIKKNDL